MSPDVKAHAEALAKALAESEEYNELVEATEALENHEAAKIMLRDFQQKQMALQAKVMGGQEPSEAEMAALQEAYQLATFNPYVRRVVAAETAFSNTLSEIQRLLAEAVGLPVDDEGAEAADGGGVPESSEGAKPAMRVVDGGGEATEERPKRSRLWVPGQP